MSELGTYAPRFASFRQMMSAVPEDARLPLFENAVKEAANCVARGLDRAAAADELQDMATAFGLSGNPDFVQSIISEAFEDIERVPDQIEEEAKPYTNGKSKPQSAILIIEPTLYIRPDPTQIEVRAWMHATHYIRGAVTGTVAPGGFGKTTLALFEALYMCNEGYRVWYISGEDDKVELDRRIAAHCEQYPSHQFTDRLFIDDKLSFPFKIAKSGRNGPEFDNAKLTAFEQAIARRKIDVVTLDPFVSFHLLSENDTAAMDTLVKRLGDIAIRCKCCIELPHHVRKPGLGQFEITVYDARGAAAIVNAVRSCRVLNQMSMIEAQQVRIPIEQRFGYIRIDSGKRNMAPPEKARWLHLKSVQIANGDWVQALEHYEFKPDMATDADEAWVRTEMSSKQYRADSRSPDWFGHAVAHHFNRSAETEGDIKWINSQIRKWLNPAPHRQKAVIRKVEREDEHRKKRLFFELVTDSSDAQRSKATLGNES
jgi:hypothetical protein